MGSPLQRDEPQAPLPKLSILVPYRNRPDHLREFLPHMVTYFSRDKLDKFIPYNITVIEQANDGRPFNRGMMLNVGILLNPDADYYCFHDVDYLPIWADYRYADSPTRIIWYGADVRPQSPGSSQMIPERYDLYFSGAILMNRADALKTNGYPNDYWGWGWEDNELRARCMAENLEIKYRDGTFRALPHVAEGFTPDLKPTPASTRNQALLKVRAAEFEAGKAPHRQNGITTARFKIIERRHAKDPGGRELQNVEKVTVEIGEP